MKNTTNMSQLTQQVIKSKIILLIFIAFFSCSKPSSLQKGRYHSLSFDNHSIIIVKNKKLKFTERGGPSIKIPYHLLGDSAIETLGGKIEMSIIIVKSGDYYILDPNHYCYQKNRKDSTYKDCLQLQSFW